MVLKIPRPDTVNGIMVKLYRIWNTVYGYSRLMVTLRRLSFAIPNSLIFHADLGATAFLSFETYQSRMVFSKLLSLTSSVEVAFLQARYSLRSYDLLRVIDTT